MRETAQLIALAAGGTGGHVYPALTLATELRQQDYEVVLFTDHRGERFLKGSDIPYHVIQSATLQKGLLGKMRTLFKLGLGYIQCQLHYFKNCPVAIVGFGGYPSFPPVIAAAHRGVPVILHEQNAVFGRAQRMLTRYAKTVCLSFPQTRLIDSVPADKIRVTGLPLRADILHLKDAVYHLPMPNEAFRILITGGSLGSALFSRIIPQAMAKLSDEMKRRIHIMQQCRAEDVDGVQEFYRQNSLNATVVNYLHDMPAQLSQAHLVIARAGASTTSEIALSSRPAIFIPLAVSLDGDQAANAANIIDVGGGWILTEKDFTPESLAAMLQDILNQPARLTAAASVLKGLSRPEATHSLAQAVTDALL